jgi:hypothetical protein
MVEPAIRALPYDVCTHRRSTWGVKSLSRRAACQMTEPRDRDADARRRSAIGQMFRKPSANGASPISVNPGWE